ncbi:YnbE family lipoprotein [Altererythrobacter sp. RZ02]|uniref:YnbE family lipoprotein n=2 Tax=Pontixanthobacter rizhaonensis TaxID=2730337 RepID=A0A848QM21_9SPHN|nr:YnbE family lipoprotein [Pontixanthobacter rizhaonensis]
MRGTRLTYAKPDATRIAMIGAGRMDYRKIATATALVAGLSALGGCINVNAPSEPIVIELNINITQEVIYRLAEDAGNTIDENADIF